MHIAVSFTYLEVARGSLHGAIEQLLTRGTAMGPDGIHMQLITFLAPKSKQKLRETVSSIITAGSVPEQWRLA